MIESLKIHNDGVIAIAEDGIINRNNLIGNIFISKGSKIQDKTISYNQGNYPK